MNAESKKKFCDDISFTSHDYFLHLYMAVYTEYLQIKVIRICFFL